MAHAFARAAAHRLRLSSSPSQLSFRRNFSSDHHGSTKKNIWEDPLHPGNWKEEQFVFVSLAGWGLIFYGGYKAATGGKKAPKTDAPAAADTPAPHEGIPAESVPETKTPPPKH